MNDPESLETQLGALREQATARLPKEASELSARAIAELETTVVRQALAVGEVAPDFTLAVAGSGRKAHLGEELERGPAILSFYRGHWCPYCNLELQGVQRRYSEIKALGAQVFFIGPETEEDALKLMEKQHATIPLLFDLDGRVMDAYRISFEIPEYLRPGYARFGLPGSNPGTGWRLPIPATFVLDRSGVVRARYVNADYTHRMEPADIIRALAAMSR